MRLFPLLLLCLGLAVSGCDSSEGDYPAAGAFPSVQVAELARQPTGSYNTEAVVSAANECPDGSFCIQPDGVELAEALDQQLGRVFVTAAGASQFTVGARYRFSVRVQRPAQARGPEPEGLPTFTLLGYDAL